MSGYVIKRVYSNRRNVDIGGGLDKAGLPGSVGIPVMLRKFIAKRAQIKSNVVSEEVVKFVAVGANGAVMYSSDGINWTITTTGTNDSWNYVTH